MKLELPYTAAAEELFKRVSTVLSAKNLELYDRAVKAPTVVRFMGNKRPPFMVWCEPMPQSTTTRGGATTWAFQTEFDLSVYMFATHTDPDEATKTVDYWINSICMGIAADATLNRTVDIAIPRLADAGYDTTPEKKYIAAAQIEVNCRKNAICPKEFREMLRESN